MKPAAVPAVILLWLTCVRPSAFCLPAASKAEAVAIVNKESADAMRARQQLLTNLPAPAVRQVEYRLQEKLQSDPEFSKLLVKYKWQSTDLLKKDPLILSLRDRIKSNQILQQVVIDPNKPGNEPAVIDPGGLTQTGPQLYPDVSRLLNTQSATIVRIAKSIGRIRYSIKTAATPKWFLAGTVFVVGPDTVATACHVLEAIANVQGDNLALANNLNIEVDFGEADDPGPATFTITQIMGRSSIEGLDVALLKVESTHGPSVPLPAPLVLSRTLPSELGPIAVIGYPELSDLTPDRCATAADHTSKFFCHMHQTYPKAVKIISPGHFLSNGSHSGFNSFSYDAPTRSGQSGSPVVDLNTGMVVGVHYCCNGDIPTAHILSCSTAHIIDVKSNEAIASPSIWADRTLSQFLRPQIASIQ